ncbi:MAG: glutathione S-transferase [Rhodobacteraceae bacterium]|nr:glutathione S-transferase [Paracoccaceae bacterium]
MKLYHAGASPFARKVVVVLHETGQLGDVEIIDTSLSPFAPQEDYLAKNPLSKLPALERPDGPSLYDSRVICAYLDDRGNGGLYPDGNTRWDTLVLEATADGIMDAGVLMVYEARFRPEDKQWPEWVDAQWSKVSGAIKALNDRWISQLTGPIGIGQIAVACALGYIDLRHGDRNWREGNDALAAWYGEFETRDSMVATRPPASV